MTADVSSVRQCPLASLPLACNAATMPHSAVASGAIWTPLDVLKSRLQTGREGTSAIALTKRIIRDEGWMGLMRGYWVGTAIFM